VNDYKLIEQGVDTVVPKIEQARHRIKYFLAGVAVACANLKETFIELISDVLPLPSIVQYSVVFSAALTAVMVSIGKFVDFAINNIAIFRRIIMWNDDVEGEWIDFVYHPDRSQDSIGIVTIGRAK
jgi:hypothetical protein